MIFNSPARHPERLFDELKKNHLLILGEDYSDWLVRIFFGPPREDGYPYLRLRAFSRSWPTARPTGIPWSLSWFISAARHGYSRRTGLLSSSMNLEPLAGRHPQSTPAVEEQLGHGMPRNAIFISYTREDLAAVQELKAGLEAAGLPVWFDQQSLKPGDNFKPQIEQYIARSCSCFIAVISKNTERRRGILPPRMEHGAGAGRGIHYGRNFIVPVVVDDAAHPIPVPPRFSQLNYTWLPGGTSTPPFVRELKEILSGS